MVDYSRWDALDVSDDECDRAKAKPQVHAFKGPQTVTIGAPGTHGQVQVSPQEVAGQDVEVDSDDEPMEPMDEDLEGANPDEDRREDVLNLRGLAERALRGGDPHEAVRLLEKALAIGGTACPGLEDVLSSARRQVEASEPAHNKSVEAKPAAPKADAREAAARAGTTVDDRYHWLQTRETVEVSVFVPSDTKAKQVSIDVTEKTVRVAVAGVAVLEGDWEFKVEPEEDTDWEVCECQGRRAVRIVVRKANLPGNLSVVVWWKRLLKGEPEIDISNVEGEKQQARAESFAKAWAEAHTQFREKVQQHRPIPVELPPLPAQKAS